MRTVNIYDFFPIPNDEVLGKYLLRDRDYEERKEQLSTILFNVITPKKKNFGKAVIDAIFDPEYIRTHRWPTVG